MRAYRSKPTAWDALTAAVIAALAAASAFFLWGGGPDASALTAVVSIDGREADRVALASLSAPEVRTYGGRGYTLEIEFSPEGVRVAAADCPNQDCVHTGEVSGAGRSVVCLPARISVRLTGSGGVDAVLG